MKPFVTAVVISVLVCTLGGCLQTENGGCSESRIRVDGSGHVVSEERPVQGVTGVNLATIGTLYIEFGSEEKLIIEAEDNLIDYFRTRVRGDMLTIETRRNTNLHTRKPVKYRLTVRDLNSISISSSGDIFAPDIEAGRFKVNVSSSGDLEIGDLKADLLRVTISSSGDVEIGKVHAGAVDVSISSSGSLYIAGGKTEEQDVTISSSGSYHGGDLESARARIRLSSSGNAHIFVVDELDVVLSSSGSVYYAGNPSVRQSISSSGRLKRTGI
jgi:hypothetical protein